MRKTIMVVTLLLFALVVGGEGFSVIDREDLSLKAGPTEPGEELSLAWLEVYVYPKVTRRGKELSLGVRLISKVATVEASFGFGVDKISLTSSDGTNWSGTCKIPENADIGLHVVRYVILGKKGRIQRVVEFFIEESIDLTEEEKNIFQDETIYPKGWLLTVVSTYSAWVGGSSRILYPGQGIVGRYKIPWYKVVFEDGNEGWVPAAMVKEPLKEFCELGYAAYQDKNYAAAIKYYENTVAINPNFVKGYFWLAKSYYHQGDLDAAYRLIVEAMRLDERDMNSKVFAAVLAQEYFKIARAKFRAKRYHEAVATYQKVLKLKPSSVLSWLELGKSYSKLGFPEKARSAWQEVLRIEPRNREIHALLNLNFPLTATALKPGLSLPESRQGKESPPFLASDSLKIVKEGKTKKGTMIKAALKSVIALTRSLGTSVVEKGWAAKKDGRGYLVRYICDQGEGVREAFEWLVDIDTKTVSANNDNAKQIMARW